MSEQQTPEKKSWLPKFRFSAAAKVAICVALGLLVLTCLAWWLYLADASRVAWGDYMTWQRGLTIALLYCAAVITTYIVARLWLEQIPAYENAIEAAWLAGEQALARHGLSLQDAPLFLVLGISERSTMDHVLEASGQKLLESGVPKSEAPLRWYLTDEGVYLFIGRASLLAKLNERIRQRTGVGKKILPAQAVDPATESPVTNTEDLPGPSSHTLHRLHELENMLDSELTDGPSNERLMPKEPSWTLNDLVTTAEQIALKKSIAAISNRLRSARAPVAAFNGILTFFDGPSVASGQKNAWLLGKAAALELEQVTRIAGVHAPNQCVIGELQHEPGWLEMIRRFGAQNTDDMLVGAPIEPTQLLEPSDAIQLGDSSGRAIRQNVLTLFGSPNLLGTTGNEQLVELLIRLRQTWTANLSRLGQELIHKRCSEGPAGEASPGFLGGIFFAATGSKASHRAFVRPLFSRLVGQQDLLEWTTDQKKSAWRLTLTLRLLQSSFAIALAILAFQILR